VESYLRIVGTNGSLFADFIRGITVALPGPGTSGVSKVLNPYSQAWQIAGTSAPTEGHPCCEKYPVPRIMGPARVSKRTHSGRTVIVETVRVRRKWGSARDPGGEEISSDANSAS
jgi:hypothetical protein